MINMFCVYGMVRSELPQSAGADSSGVRPGLLRCAAPQAARLRIRAPGLPFQIEKAFSIWRRAKGAFEMCTALPAIP